MFIKHVGSAACCHMAIIIQVIGLISIGEMTVMKIILSASSGDH